VALAQGEAYELLVIIMLRLDQVTAGYASKPVLRQITLHLQPGEVLGIVGPNGVGKSTLVKVASGVLPPFQGRVWVDGSELSHLPPPERARLIAVVPQATQLPAAFQALDIVMLGRTPYLGWLGREGESDYRIVAEVMEKTGTAQLAGRRVGELSGGEQQKLLIARALAQTPSVLLLDEPTAHLDLKHQDEILGLVRSLALNQGLSVMLTLHDLNLVARFADRVALLSNGTIHRIGKPSEVLTPQDLAAVYGLEIHVIPHPIRGTPLVLS
jgi:iron complex transport system ATP-binding protein